ncbi:hypothetical protein E1A91_A10G028700v1 [Gossypium mustelinum]|uniref:DNA ligase 1 n=1 Tax=Gossypium mustelinum TaxID=34275 RepID=A0A5D2XGS2_GOSMU|nr:hypothetical protein E1A91_A10G028700v1 [Gossypium mustelinum]
MSTSKARNKKRGSESLLGKSDPKTRLIDDFDPDPDLSNDLKGIMSALQLIKEKAQKDGKKKNEETISSVAAEIRSKLDDLKSKFEKERQTFAKALTKSSKECENCLKSETAKFQKVYEKFCKEKTIHMQSLKGKKEKSLIIEQEKFYADKITQLEESLKKKKQDERTFSILRKTLGSFLDNGSDEDFPPED